jgi:haloacetate dehalogenase
MARDSVALMRALGHERFAVAGHDRGSYVAFRTAMDHPHAVTALAVLDSIPIGEALARADVRFASAWWHWFFFRPDLEAGREDHQPRPRRLVHGDGGCHGRGGVRRLSARDPRPAHRSRHGRGLPRRAHRRPRHDDVDHAAGRRVRCPTLVAWSVCDDLEELWGDPVAIWRDWAEDVRGARIDSGHHIAEEAPEVLAEVLDQFVSGAS